MTRVQWSFWCRNPFVSVWFVVVVIWSVAKVNDELATDNTTREQTSGKPTVTDKIQEICLNWGFPRATLTAVRMRFVAVENLPQVLTNEMRINYLIWRDSARSQWETLASENKENRFPCVSHRKNIVDKTRTSQLHIMTTTTHITAPSNL